MKRKALIVFAFCGVFILGIVSAFAYLNREEEYQTFIEPVYRSQVNGTKADDNGPGQMRLSVYKKKNMGWKGVDGGTEFWFRKVNGKWMGTHIVHFMESRISSMKPTVLQEYSDLRYNELPFQFDGYHISEFYVSPHRCSAFAEVYGATKKEALQNVKVALDQFKFWMESQHFVCPGK